MRHGFYPDTNLVSVRSTTWVTPGNQLQPDSVMVTIFPLYPWATDTDKVERRIEENPDQINVVPVDGAGLDTPVFLRRIMALSSQVPHDNDENDTANDVQGMHAGHGEDDCAVDVVPGRQVGLVVKKTLGDAGEQPPLEDHHTKEKDRTQNGRTHQPPLKGSSVSVFHGCFGQVHGEAAQQQNASYDQSNRLI